MSLVYNLRAPCAPAIFFYKACQATLQSAFYNHQNLASEKVHQSQQVFYALWDSINTDTKIL